MNYFIYEIDSEGNAVNVEGHVNERKALERWVLRRDSDPKVCTVYVEKAKVTTPERRAKLARAAGRNKYSTKA